MPPTLPINQQPTVPTVFAAILQDAVRYFHETLDLYTDNTSVRVKYLQVHSSSLAFSGAS